MPRPREVSRRTDEARLDWRGSYDVGTGFATNKFLRSFRRESAYNRRADPSAQLYLSRGAGVMTLGAQTKPYGKLLDYEQFIDHQLGRTRTRIKLTDIMTA